MDCLRWSYNNPCEKRVPHWERSDLPKSELAEGKREAEARLPIFPISQSRRRKVVWWRVFEVKLSQYTLSQQAAPKKRLSVRLATSVAGGTDSENSRPILGDNCLESYFSSA